MHNMHTMHIVHINHILHILHMYNFHIYFVQFYQKDGMFTFNIKNKNTSLIDAASTYNLAIFR
jgi:hypothetical protein